MGKLFDGLFDFNGDGKTSMFEAILGVNMMQEKTQSSEMQKGLSNDYLLDSMPELYPGEALEHLEDVQELHDQVEELHSKLEELEWDEPRDWTSEAHAFWEEARDELENRIEDIENANPLGKFAEPWRKMPAEMGEDA